MQRHESTKCGTPAHMYDTAAPFPALQGCVYVLIKLSFALPFTNNAFFPFFLSLFCLGHLTSSKKQAMSSLRAFYKGVCHVFNTPNSGQRRAALHAADTRGAEHGRVFICKKKKGEMRVKKKKKKENRNVYNTIESKTWKTNVGVKMGYCSSLDTATTRVVCANRSAVQGTGPSTWHP